MVCVGGLLTLELSRPQRRTVPNAGGGGGSVGSRTRVDASTATYDAGASTFSAALVNPTMDSRLTLNIFLLKESTVRVKVFEGGYDGVDWRCIEKEGRAAPPACRPGALRRQLASEQERTAPTDAEDAQVVKNGTEEESQGEEEEVLLAGAEAKQEGWGLGEPATTLPRIHRPLFERFDASEAAIEDSEQLLARQGSS